MLGLWLSVLCVSVLSGEPADTPKTGPASDAPIKDAKPSAGQRSHPRHVVTPGVIRQIGDGPAESIEAMSNQQHLIEPDMLMSVNNLLGDIRNVALDPIGLTFEPSAGWTYQHSTKTRPGYPHARSALWYAWAGNWTLWNDEDGLGQIVYYAGGNTGLGDSTYPYMGEALGNPDYLNNILVPDRIGLYMLYWQQEMFDHKLTVRIGKMEDQAFFDLNTIAYNPVIGFLAENFNEQIVMPFPNYAFGFNAQWQLTDDILLRGGTLNSANPGNNNGFQGLSWSHLFTTAEVDFTMRPSINGAERVGHIRVTPWFNSQPDPFGPGIVEGLGVCLNMDQRVTDTVSIFGRLGWGENQATRSNFAVSTGLAISAPFGLTHHHTGIAIEYAKITAMGRSEVDLPSTPGEQYMLEWYWRFELSQSFDIGPVVQVVRDTVAGIDTAVIWGFRSSWSF